MKHQGDLDVCRMIEQKGRPVRLRNLQTGEVGTVIQCTGWKAPSAFMARIGDEGTSWVPGEVEEVESEAIPPEEGVSHEERSF